MESNGSGKPDLGELINEAIFQSGFSSFYDYLETIVDFLENERKSHNQSIDEINEKLKSGEIESPDDPGQMPPELEFDYFRLERISEFENILFSSFFVSIYFYLESELTKHCGDIKQQSQEGLSLSDIAGRGVQRAMIYLVKVHRIEFSLDNNPEWGKIQNFNLLRNCIVHNQGRLDDGFEGGKKKLLEFVQKPNSKLKLVDTWCVLDKDFCLEALDTIQAFLHSVIFARKKTQ